MDKRIKAALVAAGVMLVPGAVQASSGWMVAISFDDGTAELTGVTKTWSEETVRHVAGTQNKFIGNPNIIPPGPCRAVAIKWNIGVFMNRPRRWFLKQLDSASKYNCNFDFTRSDTPNTLGSFDLVSISPSP